jgi:hypothetical protein
VRAHRAHAAGPWIAPLALLLGCGEAAPRLNQPPIAVLGRDLTLPPGVELAYDGLELPLVW